MVFGIFALGLLLLEFGVWAYTSPVRNGKIHGLVRRMSEATVVTASQANPPRRKRFAFRRFIDNIEIAIVSVCVAVMSILHLQQDATTAACRAPFGIGSMLYENQMCGSSLSVASSCPSRHSTAYGYLPDFSANDCSFCQLRMPNQHLGKRTGLPRLHSVAVFEQSSASQVLDRKNNHLMHLHGPRKYLRCHRVVSPGTPVHSRLRRCSPRSEVGATLPPIHVLAQVSWLVDRRRDQSRSKSSSC